LVGRHPKLKQEGTEWWHFTSKLHKLLNFRKDGLLEFLQCLSILFWDLGLFLKRCENTDNSFDVDIFQRPHLELFFDSRIPE